MKEASKSQINYMKGLAIKQGINLSDEALNLSSSEASRMIKSLLGEDQKPTASQKMKNKIISMAHTLGWETDTGKVDMDRLNNWCKKYGSFHKELDEHSYKQLTVLVTQFQQGTFKHELSSNA